MVNHLRTLFLNEDPDNADFKASSLSFPVDLSFRKISLSGSLKELYDDTMYGAESADDKIKRVNSIRLAMSRVDLKDGLPIRDLRETRYDDVDVSFDPNSVFNRKSVETVLYKTTGIPSYDNALAWLKACTNVDGPMRTAAGICAYAIQLEAVRTGNG